MSPGMNGLFRECRLKKPLNSRRRDAQRSELENHKDSSLVYAGGVRPKGAREGEPLGVLGVLFDWDTEAQKMLRRSLPKNRGGKFISGSAAFYTSRGNIIIESTSPEDFPTGKQVELPETCEKTGPRRVRRGNNRPRREKIPHRLVQDPRLPRVQRPLLERACRAPLIKEQDMSADLCEIKSPPSAANNSWRESPETGALLTDEFVAEAREHLAAAEPLLLEMESAAPEEQKETVDLPFPRDSFHQRSGRHAGLHPCQPADASHGEYALQTPRGRDGPDAGADREASGGR